MLSSFQLHCSSGRDCLRGDFAVPRALPAWRWPGGTDRLSVHGHPQLVAPFAAARFAVTAAQAMLDTRAVLRSLACGWLPAHAAVFTYSPFLLVSTKKKHCAVRRQDREHRQDEGQQEGQQEAKVVMRRQRHPARLRCAAHSTEVLVHIGRRAPAPLRRHGCMWGSQRRWRLVGATKLVWLPAPPGVV